MTHAPKNTPEKQEATEEDPMERVWESIDRAAIIWEARARLEEGEAPAEAVQEEGEIRP